VRNAKPLTTDLNIRIRSEKCRVLADCKSKTLNMTEDRGGGTLDLVGVCGEGSEDEYAHDFESVDHV
jgi:hypothetical protein